MQPIHKSTTSLTTRRAITSTKPFCKVCFDSGKTMEECSSHFLKNIPGPDGIIICPTLLAICCFKCNKKGHTISYCPSSKKIKKEEMENQRRTLLEQKERGVNPNTIVADTTDIPKKNYGSNSFSSLDFSFEKNKKERPFKKQNHPESTIIPKPVLLVTYASIAKSPPVIFQEKELLISNIAISVTKQSGSVQGSVPFIRKRWADMDSDEEE